MKAPGEGTFSSALQGSDFSPRAGDAETPHVVLSKLKTALWVLPVSSLYSPSGQSTHSKQQVGSPSIMPFLVPGRQSLLQLEKGTCKKRAQGGLMVAVSHVQPFYSRSLAFLQGCYGLISMLDGEPQWFPSSLHRTDTFCTIGVPQPTAVIFV